MLLFLFIFNVWDSMDLYHYYVYLANGAAWGLLLLFAPKSTSPPLYDDLFSFIYLVYLSPLYVF